MGGAILEDDNFTYSNIRLIQFRKGPVKSCRIFISTFGFSLIFDQKRGTFTFLQGRRYRWAKEAMPPLDPLIFTPGLM